jgi:very-short-patch-repair endonuclease
VDLEALDRVAAGQHGLVTSAQAIELLGRSRTYRWGREGRLVAVQPGVWRLLGSPSSWHQDLLAAQLSSGGLASHRAATELWGMLRPTGHVDVAVSWKRQPRLRPPAVVHRSVDLDPDDGVVRGGHRVTDPVRTIVDLGLVVPPELVADALSNALSKRLLLLEHVQRLRAELSKCGRTGVGIIGEILERRWPELNTEESVLEGRLLGILRDHELPMPTTQFEVWHGGRFVARIDLAYPDALVAVELDGFEHHSTPEAFQRDRARQNDLVALGWMVLRFTWQDVARRPLEVIDSIRSALRTRRPASVCA